MAAKNQTSTIDPQLVPPPNRVDLDRALKLRMKGATYTEIAELQGVSKQAVQQRVEGFLSELSDPEAIQVYRENEAEILDAAKLRLVRNLIVKADDKKASVNNLAYAYTQLNTAGRLLRGQSTSNIHALTSIIEQAHNRSGKQKSENVEANQSDP